MKALEEEKTKTIAAQKEGAIRSEHFMAYIMLAFLANVVTRDIGQSNKSKLEMIMSELWAMDMDLVAEMFPGIYVEKVVDADKARLLLALHQCPHRAIIISSLKQLDFVHKLGEAEKQRMLKKHYRTMGVPWPGDRSSSVPLPPSEPVLRGTYAVQAPKTARKGRRHMKQQ